MEGWGWTVMVVANMGLRDETKISAGIKTAEKALMISQAEHNGEG
jgi:hypothetical protein